MADWSFKREKGEVMQLTLAVTTVQEALQSVISLNP
jgi:hypothetical protein